jgi:hypothetical protein
LLLIDAGLPKPTGSSPSINPTKSSAVRIMRSSAAAIAEIDASARLTRAKSSG